MKTYSIVPAPNGQDAVHCRDGLDGRTLDPCRIRSLFKGAGVQYTMREETHAAILLDATNNELFTLDYYREFTNTFDNECRLTIPFNEIVEWTAEIVL